MKAIAPSILSADFLNLGSQISECLAAGCSIIHCDIMDGHFVPNITFGPLVVSAVNKMTDATIDVHLMIKNPDLYIEDFVKAGADYITVHYEEVVHLHRTLTYIKSLGAKCGVAINPSTPVEQLSEIIDMIDLLLIMSVNPGFGGQEFIPNSINKIKKAAALRAERGLGFLIEVDGGISVKTISSVSEAGCNLFVAGNAVFGQKDIRTAFEQLNQQINNNKG